MISKALGRETGRPTVTLLWRQAPGNAVFQKWTTQVGGKAGLFHPAHHRPQPSPLLALPGDRPNPWVCFFELGWPIRLFRKTCFFSVQARISMEIETSFFRGPLLTSPSHISIGESVPGPCSEERGIHPASWQVVPRSSARDLTAPECRPFPGPGLQQARAPRGAVVFLIRGTAENLSNLSLSLSSFFCTFNTLLLSVWKHQVLNAAENEGSCQKSERKEKIQCYPQQQQRRSRITTMSTLQQWSGCASLPTSNLGPAGHEELRVVFQGRHI